jgi:hypothetical protein
MVPNDYYNIVKQLVIEATKNAKINGVNSPLKSNYILAINTIDSEVEVAQENKLDHCGNCFLMHHISAISRAHVRSFFCFGCSKGQ